MKTKTALKKFTKLVELKKRALDLYVYSWRKFLNSKDIKDKKECARRLKRFQKITLLYKQFIESVDALDEAA